MPSACLLREIHDLTGTFGLLHPDEAYQDAVPRAPFLSAPYRCPFSTFGRIEVSCRPSVSAACAAHTSRRRSSTSECHRCVRAMAGRTRLDEPEVFYPLHVRQCPVRACSCNYRPKSRARTFFQIYAYFSSYSDSWVAHAKRFADSMTTRLALTGDRSRHRGGQ